MTAADLAAVLLTLAGITVTVLVLVVGLSLLRALRDVRLELARLRRDTLPLVHEMRDAVAAAGAEVARVDELVAQAEDVTASLEASSRVVEVAVTNPLIKVVAVVRGTFRAVVAALTPWRRRRRRRARRVAGEQQPGEQRRGRAA